MRTRPLAAGCGAALILAIAGCISSTEPEEVVTLEADLVAAEGPFDPVSGSAAMVIGRSQTQMGLGIHDAEAGARLGWAFRTGSCSGSGERIGPASTYPSIEVGETGDGSAEAVLFRRVATDRAYAGEVFSGPDGSGDVLACADLDPRD